MLSVDGKIIRVFDPFASEYQGSSPEKKYLHLKAWALARRFTKFTDCKIGMNKLKNGKAPLELAGVKVEGVDYLIL